MFNSSHEYLFQTPRRHDLLYIQGVYHVELLIFLELVEKQVEVQYTLYHQWVLPWIKWRIQLFAFVGLLNDVLKIILPDEILESVRY